VAECEYCDDGYHHACTPGGIVHVHGGLTFAAGCAHGEDEAEGVCHRPGAGEPDDVWWFGFDCAHSGDLSPATRSIRTGSVVAVREVYRDLSYVEEQVSRLARQLVAVR
jgi:hypothetical protein